MNSSGRIRLLLDSTYLLPIIGIEVEDTERTLLTLKKLHQENRAEYYYTPFNMLEILGKLSRARWDYDRVAAGLHAIEEGFNLTYQTAEGCLKALDLRSRGHRDLIDLLLYTTSLTRNIPFLTRDYTLIEFLKENGETTENILREDELLKKYSLP